ncbi:effector protein B, substrate of the Dot/Icm secretion system [Legionella gratiana]|uniref:Effector protein B, substrate of the Dot/Icm secretion system n=1 Tax=Legionella gratiana TaxID=45066 RepID=A0A378JCB4_9GAMM|nr:hypothetical protein [Legionella gratiana]KTD11776.1 effector protein B, substrate of the Dot/Icm secretion system [Legionella gratiana]STX45453.1 LepB protein [Legionella gratiana]
MPAFTRLCKNVHISVAHNTVTLYVPKTVPWYSLYQQMMRSNYYDPTNNSILKPIWPLRIYNPFDPEDPFVKRLSPVQPVHREYPDHEYYHDDALDREITHFHMKFTRNISIQDFDVFLTILVEKDIIDRKEKEDCFIAFIQASQDAVTKFYDELATVQLKALELNEKAKTNPKAYQKAAEAAEELYDTLKNEARTYFNNKNAKKYELFRSNCKQAIKKASKELQNHRGWGDVLLNVSAAILGLGILYVAALGINYAWTHGEHLFFHCDTDSIKKIKKLEEAQSALLRI